MSTQAVVLACNFLFPILLQKGMGYTGMSAVLIILPGAMTSGIMSLIMGTYLELWDMVRRDFSS